LQVDAVKVRAMLDAFTAPPVDTPPPPTPPPTPPRTTGLTNADISNAVISSLSTTTLSNNLTISLASPTDVSGIYKMITELAVFEKEPDAVNTTLSSLANDMTGEAPMYRVIVIKNGIEVVGMAFWFLAYSTWEGRVLYLEDLYISPEYRGGGVGKTCMRLLATIATKLNCGRMSWQALDWNIKAIDFYKSLGAEVSEEWVNCRFTREGLEKFVGAGV
jgi:GNAT superfamily N-acetyltransferase